MCLSHSQHTPLFSWHFNGAPLSSSGSERPVVSNTVGASVLTLPAVSEDQLGVYTCWVEDRVHLAAAASCNVSETSQLYTVATAAGEVWVPLGSAKTLECPVRSGTPPLAVSWQHDKEHVVDGLRLTVSADVAMEELEEVEGEYTCKVEDGRGAEAEASFTVVVTGESLGSATVAELERCQQSCVVTEQRHAELACFQHVIGQRCHCCTSVPLRCCSVCHRYIHVYKFCMCFLVVPVSGVYIMHG